MKEVWKFLRNISLVLFLGAVFSYIILIGNILSGIFLVLFLPFVYKLIVITIIGAFILLIVSLIALKLIKRRKK